MESHASERIRLRDRLSGDALVERLLWILDDQLEGVLVTDAEGTIVDANEAAVRLSGLPVHELIGAGPDDALWNDLLTLEGGPLPAEERPPRRALRTGERAGMLLRFRGRVLRVESGCAGEDAERLCITVFLDVTQEIEAQEEAAAARRHVERIAEITDRAMYSADVQEDGSLRIGYTSPGFDRLVGHPIVGRSLHQAVRAVTHPDDLRRVARYEAALARGESIDDVHRIVTPDGLTRWVRTKVVPWQRPDGGRCIDGVLTDVTAERLDRARLEATVEAHRASALEQAALGRLATAIAAGASPQDVFAAIAAEVGRLMEVPVAFVAQYVDDDQAVVRGLWPRDVPGVWDVGSTFSLAGTAGEAVKRDRSPTHVVAGPDDELPQRLGAPILLGDELWGYLGVIAGPSVTVQDVPDRLKAFADLVATAVASASARERLVEQASTDPLTRLVNHRVFQERLRAEVTRAQRHARPLALVLADLDHFKQINDALGHQAGDEVLRRVAATLRDVARTSDTVARLGGDEFAMLLPETDIIGGCHLADRVREVLAEDWEGPGPVTISAGVAELAEGLEADDLLRRADGALYSAKADGRDTVRRYRPDQGLELTAEERIERLARSQALTALRALARVIDLKDPSTREHSERVASVAVRLAQALGWAEDRVRLLHQAGLLHDVGKVAVPDAVLFKRGLLNADEYEQIKRHAPVGAAIASEALSDEQVLWIRHHHERPDGRGYPDGLGRADIPEGAQILAVADAWDVMTSSRPYKTAKPRAEALAECRRLIGEQFDQRVVEALERICASDPDDGG